VRPRTPSLARGALAVLLAAAPSAARAAVTLDAFSQESASATNSIDVLNLTVGNGANRFLMVAVSMDRLDRTVTGVTWRGTPLTLLDSQGVSAGGPCRTELWGLASPAPGRNDLRVDISGPSAFGVGVASFTGVGSGPTSADVKWLSAAGGAQATVSVPTTTGSAVFGSVCVAGNWNATMPSPNAPSARVDQGQSSLWDFTEPGVVGVGTQVDASGSSTTVRWNITSQVSYDWLAAGVSLDPPLPPDAAPAPPLDGGVDQRPAVDTRPTDLAIPPDAAAALDAAPGRDTAPGPDAPAPDDAAGTKDDAQASSEDGGPSAPDAAFPSPADARSFDPDAAPATPVSVKDVNLQVGCACDLNGRRRPAVLFPLLGLLGLFRRLSSRTASGRARSR
jgi:hypothetical protein